MTIAVLALQGAFIEHEKMLERLGVSSIELRNAADLEKNFDGIILPGGESTVQGKLLHTLDMFLPLQKRIQDGLPVLATCAGLILLAEKLQDDPTRHFAALPVCVQRNAYGRQLGSFHTEGSVTGIGTVPMTFIRAPYVVSAADGVETLAVVNGKIVGVRYRSQTAYAFHPELDSDTRIHEDFLRRIR